MALPDLRAEDATAKINLWRDQQLAGRAGVPSVTPVQGVPDDDIQARLSTVGNVVTQLNTAIET